jgi:histone H3/H4
MKSGSKLFFGQAHGRMCHPQSASTGYKYQPAREPDMADLIVKAAVKDHLDQMNVSADFYDTLGDEVSDLLTNAAQRAEDNDRKTVQPRDL